MCCRLGLSTFQFGFNYFFLQFEYALFTVWVCFQEQNFLPTLEVFTRLMRNGNANLRYVHELGLLMDSLHMQPNDVIIRTLQSVADRARSNLLTLVGDGVGS